ncbi:MAG: CvpA family protein [Flavobacteriales bacterium AspAUS03]
MNWIDALIAMPLLMGLSRGYRMGLLQQLASIVTWIFGLYGSIWFSALVSTQLGQWQLINEKYLTTASFTISFFMIVAAIYLLRKLIEWGLMLTWMYQFNRILGAIFGLLKSLLFISVSIFLFHEINKRFSVISHQILTGSVLFEKVSTLNTSLYSNLCSKVMLWFQ